MKAIVTKYHGPTQSKGARVKASDSDGNSVTVSADFVNAHEEAARMLCLKMGWQGVLIMGSLGDSERVFVWVETLVPTDAVGMRTYVEVFNGIEVR